MGGGVIRGLSVVACLFGAALAPGCRQAESSASASEPPRDECTLHTALTPGIPGSPGHLMASPLNPNGMSELAALMRQMLGDLQRVRSELLADPPGPATIPAVHRRIRCSWPTDATTREPVFDGRAQTYLRAVARFNHAARDRHARFDEVVDACLSCHENSCQGPMVVIRPLRLAPFPAGGASD